ncbi:zinc-dependent alcohol dehydrogenase family protein [Gynuella sunshinyii]|uniref:NADPH:quinone reductase and related Zn-dependent oxidoreductase n=1 Tax=Gynuella sunshinyii YC6258 TaxID=1445510 RepID=A0A0C5VF49_9GAMM|nr:zinc-dependent alcohol dehydrogenase family protein [Gynuella sunshinyii]AJQ93177.1 NADPH:quinone reductase and related Zn-dependent oxidoreductase [Gynuella sunshinyii YC6258]
MSAAASIIHQFGHPGEVVELFDQPMPEPAPGEVVVKMQRSVINPSDLITISGAYRSRIALPFQPGYEGTGMVVACGEGVTSPTVGTRVLPIGLPGNWSSYKRSPAQWCIPVSETLTLPQAATLYVNPATAWLMLHERARIQPGMRVVISAGASEIGRMLIRLLNQSGIEPVVTLRRHSSLSRLQGLALEAVLFTEEPDFDKTLNELLPSDSVDLLLDAVGGKVGMALARSLKPDGHLIHYGLLSGQPLAADLPLQLSGVRFELFVLRNWIHQAEKSSVHALFQTLEPLMLAGTVSSDIDSVFALADIHEAFKRIEDPDRDGKVLLDLM